MERSYLSSKEWQSMQSPTVGEWLVCVFLPFIGLILGFLARTHGRRGAGNTILTLSGIMIVIGIGIRCLIVFSE
jgi:hypothetical protein